MGYKVCKFGGSSLADADCFERVSNIIVSNPDRRIIVVSAPGKNQYYQKKITDMLIEAAQIAYSGKKADKLIEDIVLRYRKIAENFGVESSFIRKLEEDLLSRLNSTALPKDEFMDLVKAFGEDQCARLMAEVLKKKGIDAVYISPLEAGLIVSKEFGNAVCLDESYTNLARLRDRKEIIIFPGFFGVSREGKIVTFPRGGSDVTGAILAAAVHADEYENFTDVSYVFSADPKIVENPQPIKSLTYREMRELSYAGFSVLHEEAIIPAVRAGVPIHIRNTYKPEERGTYITLTRQPDERKVVGIAASKGFLNIFISKYLMNREVGFGRRLLQIFEKEGIPYEHTPTGIDNMSVIVREDLFTKDKEEKIIKDIKEILKPDDVYVERNLALIMVVGEGMRYTIGIAAKATAALAKAGVNIEMMNQGSSEISMMFGVRGEDMERAVRALYGAFFENKEKD